MLRTLLNGAALVTFYVAQEGLDGLAEWLKDSGLTVLHSSPDGIPGSDLPGTPLERGLAQLWQEALGLREIGIHDD